MTFNIIREDTLTRDGHIDTNIRIKFVPPGGYNGVIAITRQWMSIGGVYRTEIHWYAHSTALIAHAELVAAALLKATEIAKALNAELPTDLPYGSVNNPRLPARLDPTPDSAVTP